MLLLNHVALMLSTAASVASASSFLEDNFGPIAADVQALLNGNAKKDASSKSSAYTVGHDHVHGAGVSKDDLEYDNFINIPHPDYVADLDPKFAPLYAGIPTFAHLPLYECFGLNTSPHHPKPEFDVAIIGAPFDTAVSYRGGARFGPSGIREGSRRIGSDWSYSSINNGFNPYTDWAKVVDCGDAPMSPFDNRIALNQLYRAHRAIHNHTVPDKQGVSHKYNDKIPRIITLGGDHTVTFSALRSVSQVHGPVSVIHFDSHIDTWDPVALGGNVSSYANLNHGTFLHFAHEKGYLVDDGNMHVGVRAPFTRKNNADLIHDKHCGFDLIMARDIDRIGVHGIARKIKERVGNNKVYISIDIDVLDPAYAPGTGTAEPGGYTTREFLTLLDLLQGLNVVGADVVEVAPAYDSAGQITVLAAAQVVDSLLELMIYEGLEGSEGTVVE